MLISTEGKNTVLVQMNKASLKFHIPRKMEMKQQRLRSSMTSRVRSDTCICSVLPFLYQKSSGGAGFYLSLSFGQSFPE